MAEQNILAGDIVCLGHIKEEVEECSKMKSQLQIVKQNVNELDRNISNAEKNLKDEIEKTIADRRTAVETGFDDAIAKDEDKIKTILNSRDKAKSKGVKARIQVETAELTKENKHHSVEIEELLKQSKAGKICSNKLFHSIFITSGIVDAICFAVSVCLFILLIPALVVIIVPDVKAYVILIIGFALSALYILAYKLINDKIKEPNLELIYSIVGIQKQIKENNIKIKQISTNIKKDKNEDMYNLHKYDSEIEKVNTDIKELENQKKNALEEFDNVTKSNIENEIEGRCRNRIDDMKSKLKEEKKQYSELEKDIKERALTISSNYEAYLGSEVTSPAKLDVLISIMNEHDDITIGQALAIYKTRK